MNRYVLFFGYIFYRINSVYRRVTKLAEDYQPVGIISIIQTVLLMDMFLLIYTTLFVSIREYHMPNGLMIFFATFFLVSYFINQRLLIKRYWEFDKLWRDEPKRRKRIRGLLIITVFAFIFFFSAFYLVIRQRLDI